MAREQRGRQAPRPALLVIARAWHVLKRPATLGRACAGSRADSAPAAPSNPIPSSDNQPALARARMYSRAFPQRPLPLATYTPFYRAAPLAKRQGDALH